MTLADLAKREKALLRPVVWSDADEMEFLAPLSIKEVAIEGLALRGTCLRSHPNENVMFQLEVGKPGIRTRLPLARAEWRPINQPHKNPAWARECPGHMIWGSHIHQFLDNWVPQKQAMRSGNLPAATPLYPEPRSFEEFTALVGNLFGINDMAMIECPDWIGRLL